MIKMVDRDSHAIGHHSHYIRDAPGHRYSSHLDVPDAIQKKMLRLGHRKTEKLVGWDLVKPRDNKMYYIGEYSSLKA
jgi:hypothetical protein